jgi:hypothetical protein
VHGFFPFLFYYDKKRVGTKKKTLMAARSQSTNGLWEYAEHKRAPETESKLQEAPKQQVSFSINGKAMSQLAVEKVVAAQQQKRRAAQQLAAAAANGKSEGKYNF